MQGEQVRNKREPALSKNRRLSLLPRAKRRGRAPARARHVSRMPGTKTSEKSWKTRLRSASEATHTRAGDDPGKHPKGWTGELLFQPTAIDAKQSSRSYPKMQKAERNSPGL